MLKLIPSYLRYIGTHFAASAAAQCILAQQYSTLETTLYRHSAIKQVYVSVPTLVCVSPVTGSFRATSPSFDWTSHERPGLLPLLLDERDILTVLGFSTTVKKNNGYVTVTDSPASRVNRYTRHRSLVLISSCFSATNGIAPVLYYTPRIKYNIVNDDSIVPIGRCK